MSAPIALILGSGPNIGQSVARAFAAKGYKIAQTSRKAKSDDSTKDSVHIAADLADPEAVPNVFSQVKSLLGSPPSVVVYNGTYIDSLFAPSLLGSFPTLFRFPSHSIALVHPLSDFSAAL